MELAIAIDRFEPRRGGAERYLAELAARLVARGWGVRVYCRDADEAPPGVVVVRVAAGGLTRVARERAFADAAVARARADGGAPLLAIRHVAAADLYQPHGGAWDASAAARLDADPSPWRRALRRAFQRISPRHRWFRAVERELLRRDGVAIVAVSELVRAQLIAVEPACAARITVLPPAIDVARFAAAAAAAPRPARPPQLLFCSHDFELKGLAEAIAAFARSGARDAGAKLTVVGRGRPQRARHVAEALGVAAAVRFVGACDDFAALLGDADLLLHPTWFDPCALVCLEALAAGVPVVTTTRNGAAPLVAAAGGRVVERPDATAELAASIDALLAEGDAARARARAVGATLGWEAHLARLEPLLRGAAERRRAR